VDPITSRDDWQVEMGEDPKLLKGKKGIIQDTQFIYRDLLSRDTLQSW